MSIRIVVTFLDRAMLTLISIIYIHSLTYVVNLSYQIYYIAYLKSFYYVPVHVFFLTLFPHFHEFSPRP